MANFLVRRNQKNGASDGREYRKSFHDGTNVDPFVFANTLVDSSGNEIVVNDSGQLKVVLDGKIDSNNSSIVNLEAGETFTGASSSALDYVNLIVSVKSNVEGATDGLKIEVSNDEITWFESDQYTIPADSFKTFSSQLPLEFYRVVYINGSAEQTSFFVVSKLEKTRSKPSSHRISDSIKSDDDAELGKSVLTGETPDGIFENVNVTKDGDLSISDNSSGLAISKGDVTGSSFVHKFGLAPDFDASDGVVSVWDGADDGNINQMVYQYSTTDDIDSISSSNAGDTQEIKIQGLDSDFNLVTQTATLNGQIRVALSTNLIRVFRLKNDDIADLAGFVYCYVDTALTGGIPIDSSKVRAIIQNGFNQTLMAIYTIPNGFTGYMRDWYASTAGSSKTSNYIIQLRAREYDGVLLAHKAFQLKHISSLADSGSSHIQHKYIEPEKFTAKTDVEMRTRMTATGATGAAISAGFDIVLVED